MSFNFRAQSASLNFLYVVTTLLLSACGGDGEDVPAFVIGPNGGTVTSADGKASVTISPGLLLEDLAVRVFPLPDKIKGSIGPAYQFEPNVFLPQADISITYSEDVIPLGIHESDLRLGIWVDDQWREVPGSVTDFESNTVSSIVGKLGIYAVIALTNRVVAKSVSAGGHHSCALHSDGTISCWGSNNVGQLGDGGTFNSFIPVRVTGIDNAISISAGDFGLHTCATVSDNRIKCWGWNQDGQLGDGTTTSSPTPLVVMGISNAVAVGTGNAHTCALLSNGEIKCWGLNGMGQLGNASIANSSVPVLVRWITTAVVVATGYLHTCAVLSDGDVRCWGYNDLGQLGNGTETWSSMPVTVIN